MNEFYDETNRHRHQGRFQEEAAARRHKAPKKRRSLAVWILSVVAVLLLVVVVIMGSYAFQMHKADQEFQKLSEQVHNVVPPTQSIPVTTTPPPVETTEPLPEETAEPKVVLEKFKELAVQNPDFYGWLAISGTKIDYPVMYSPYDPEKYLHSNFDGDYSYAGTPFLDAACSGDSDNLLIYAHNMQNGSMFRSLLNYQEKNYWQAHPVIRFDSLYEEQEYEVLAAFYDRIYLKSETNFKFYQFIDAADEADFQRAITYFKEKSLYDTGVETEYGDQLLTLITCAYHTDNGRFVVVAKKK